MAGGRGLLVACVAAALLGCAREAVPSELIGHWTSDDPRYEGRSLEIDSETIAFGAGEGIRSVYRAQGVEREVGGEAGTLYRLYYDAAGGPEHELRLSIPAPGKLRLDNHTELWARAGASSTGG